MTVQKSSSQAVLRQRFGAELKATREEVGLTQLGLAIRLNYGYPATVSQIERGVSAMPKQDMKAWSDALRMDEKVFARRYLYFYEPEVFACLFGEDPYALEGLPRTGKSISPVRRS